VPGLGLAWWLAVSGLPTPVWFALIAYSGVQLALLVAERRGQLRAAFSRVTIGWAAIVADVLFALALLAQATAIGDGIFPLYLLIALRVLAGYGQTPVGTVTPFLLGPVYLFSRYVGTPALDGTELLREWGLLLGSLGFGAVAIW